MAHRYTIGVDFGGSSSKATLLEDTGRVASSASFEYPSYYPFPGWLEQNADELFDAMLVNIRACLDQSGVNPADISALSIDAATHMAVLCDGNDRPVRNFIHWSDKRSTKQAQYLKENCAELLKKHSVNSVSSAWTLPQLIWLNENEPETMAKVRRVYFLKDYLRHRITGDFYTDNIEAMGAMLADDRTEQWVPELCGIVGLTVDMLPEIRKPTDIAGYVSGEFSRRSGMRDGTPVLVGTTDTVMEVYASGAVAEGCATVKLATAGRICPITTGPVPSHQFFNYKHIIPGMWYPGTGTRTCAASYKWYRDVFGEYEKSQCGMTGESPYELLNREAGLTPAGADGLIFHPYLQGEMTPYYDDELCASFTGVKMHHTKGYFTRAVMEGVAYSMRDSLEEIKARNITANQLRLIGGGAKGRLWRQILADVLNTPLTCTMDNDSSLGSAMMAGVAAGLFAGWADSVEKCVVVADTVTPDTRNTEVYSRGFETYRKTVRALIPVYHSGD